MMNGSLHPELRVQRQEEESYLPNILRNSEKYANFAAKLRISQNNILQNFVFIKHLEEHKERSLRLNSL